MQSSKDSSSAVAAAQVPEQSGAADGSRPAPQPTSPAKEELPPSSPSSLASSRTSQRTSLAENGEAVTQFAEIAAGGCVFARRVRGLPAVQALLGAYAGAKAYPGVGWALAMGEQAALLAAVVCRPLALVCRAPVSCGDWCLCKGLDVAEMAFPCVSMPPSQVYYRAQERVANCVCWPPRTAARCLARVCPGSQN